MYNFRDLYCITITIIQIYNFSDLCANLCIALTIHNKHNKLTLKNSVDVVEILMAC